MRLSFSRKLDGFALRLLGAGMQDALVTGTTSEVTPPQTTKRPLPTPTPETAHFWDGTANGQLLLQRCDDCSAAYFPPRPFCPACGCREVSVFEASGKATLYSYVINQRPGPGFDDPVALAVVELEEGPRMMTNIVDCEQTEEALQLDMPLVATYQSFVSPDESYAATLALFRPASTGGAA